MTIDQALPNRVVKDIIERLPEKPFNIRVMLAHSSNGEPWIVSVRKMDMIISVKAMTASLCGIPAKNQELFLNSTMLNDDLDVNAYSIVEDTTVIVGEKIFQVSVKRLSGHHVLLPVIRHDTILDLEQRLDDRTGIPVREQMLIVSGRQLTAHDDPLSDHVQRDATIHLVLKMRGGSEYR
jgi:hypothetical protein